MHVILLYVYFMMHPHFLKCAHDRPFRMIRVHKLYTLRSVLIFTNVYIFGSSHTPLHLILSQYILNQLKSIGLLLLPLPPPPPPPPPLPPLLSFERKKFVMFIFLRFFLRLFELFNSSILSCNNFLLI